MIADTTTSKGARQVRHHPLPVVRQSGRRGRELLHLDLRELRDRGGLPLRRGRTDAGEHRTRRDVLPRWAKIPGAQCRFGVHVHRGGLLLRHRRDPGRNRPTLGRAYARWGSAEPVRLAQGQVRAVLAGRPADPRHPAERSGPGESGPHPDRARWERGRGKAEGDRRAHGGGQRPREAREPAPPRRSTRTPTTRT